MTRKTIFDLFNEQNQIEEKPVTPVIEQPKVEEVKQPEIEETKEIEKPQEVVKEQEVIETPLEDKGVSSLAN